MKRRTFLGVSGSGLGAMWLTSTGCSAVEAARSIGGSRAYRVGDAHLVFDSDSAEYQFDPAGHRLIDRDAGVRLQGQALKSDPGHLNYPIAGEVGPDGRLYVLERGAGRVAVFDPNGKRVGAFGEGDLSMPSDLTLDDKGNVYVADTLNHRVQVFSSDGQPVLSIGAAGNPGEDRDDLNGPRSVAICDGELHVVDSGHARIQVFSLDGRHQRSYGGFGDGEGELMSASSITADAAGLLHVADPAEGVIHVFDCSGNFISRSRPQDDRGEDAVPYRLQTTPEGNVYVWTGGFEAAPR